MLEYPLRTASLFSMDMKVFIKQVNKVNITLVFLVKKILKYESQSLTLEGTLEVKYRPTLLCR